MASPLTVSGGAPVPGRDLILFNTFAVIRNACIPGLSLPFIIRWLGVVDDGVEEREELQARIKVVRAALWRLDEFKGKTDDQSLGRIRVKFENRIRDLESELKPPLDSSQNGQGTS